MSSYTINDVMRKLGALESQLGEMRRLLSKLVDAQHADERQGVTRLPDGELFVPGTGPTGTSQLSDAARAAEAALEANDVDPDVPAEGPAAERLARVTRLAEHARTTNPDNESS